MMRHRTVDRTTKRLAPKKKRVREWCTGSAAPHALAKLKSIVPGVNPVTGWNDDVVQNGIRRQQETKYVRCLKCGRRLHPRAVFDFNGYEFRGFTLPRHKEK